MVRRALFLVVVAGCATARQEPHEHDDDGGVDAATQTPADAPRTTPADAPTSVTCTPFTGMLATYSFTGASGSQAQTAASSTATGVVADPITRSPGLTAVSGATSINSSNWPIAAQLDATKYYTLKITPPAGCKLSMTTASIDARASSTGPGMASLATSADGFAAATALSTATPSAPSVAVTNASGAVEIRIYGYAATATGGTLRLQNTVTISGSLQ
jgi:hypothetical protein